MFGGEIALIGLCCLAMAAGSAPRRLLYRAGPEEKLNVLQVLRGELDSKFDSKFMTEGHESCGAETRCFRASPRALLQALQWESNREGFLETVEFRWFDTAPTSTQ